MPGVARCQQQDLPQQGFVSMIKDRQQCLPHQIDERLITLWDNLQAVGHSEPHLFVSGVTLAAARVTDSRGDDSRLPLERQLYAPETSTCACAYGVEGVHKVTQPKS